MLDKLLNEPKVIGVIGDRNSSKSNMIYWIIQELKQKYNFELFTYGLKFNVGDKKIFSLEELEEIKGSIIFIDEFFNIFDLEDRKKRKLIERTLRLLSHNNNIIFLIGLPENFKKFISNKLEIVIFNRCAIGDFINGSRIKNICLNYKGTELGTSILNIDKGKALVYNKDYKIIEVPYLRKFDSKKNNAKILCKKSAKSVPKNVRRKENERRI